MADPPALIQARQHFQAGRLDQARQLVQRFLQRDPSHAEANHSMAVILLQKGMKEQALYHVQKAASAAPEVYEYAITEASLHAAFSRSDQAATIARRVLARGDLEAAALLRLVPLCWELGDHEAALRAAERAFALDPRQARGPYSSVLSNIGESDLAVTMLRTQLDLEPDAPDTLQALALALNYCSSDPAESFQAHRQLGEVIERSARFPFPTTDETPDRPLRIGLVSPDFYSHSVAFFAEPIIQHLDRSQFRVFCYSSRLYPDDTTRRLRSLSDGWHDTAGLSDTAVRDLIRRDNIDILIDLAGLTTGGSLTLLASRAAPLLMSAIGYPNTTGLSIDFRLVDEITDPPGTEKFATEAPIRLPECFLCYKPLENTPPVNSEPPSARTGSITFGSFNTAQKLVGPVIAAWSRIVNAVPASRLLLKASQFSCPMVRSRFTARFQESGLDPSRLELLPVVKDKSGHLALYDRLDIALDTFPYNGTTTTCEALYMGVPVITFRGTTHAGRVGASLISAIDHPDLIGRDVDDYLGIASRLAADSARLRTLRASLRGRMLASPLCDGPGYAARLGAALRDAWRAYCRAGLPPEKPSR